MLSGRNFRTAAKQRALEAGKRLFHQAVGKVTGTSEPRGETARKRIKSASIKRKRQKGRRNGGKDTTGHFWIDHGAPPSPVAAGFPRGRHPLSSLSPSAPIEFAISGGGTERLDVKDTYLHVRAKVTQADGTSLAAGVDVASVNGWLHTLFSQVGVSLN